VSIGCLLSVCWREGVKRRGEGEEEVVMEWSRGDSRRRRQGFEALLVELLGCV
jgi:hypothetical protein